MIIPIRNIIRKNVIDVVAVPGVLKVPKTEYDFIIRFENYEEDYYKMLETFGLDKDKFKLIHTFKASDGARYKSIVLSDEAKHRIQEYCREYANRFDYEL